MRFRVFHGQLTATNLLCFHTSSHTAWGKGSPSQFTGRLWLSKSSSPWLTHWWPCWLGHFLKQKGNEFQGQVLYLFCFVLFCGSRYIFLTTGKKKIFLLDLCLQAVHQLYLNGLQRLGIATGKSQNTCSSAPMKSSRVCTTHNLGPFSVLFQMEAFI